MGNLIPLPPDRRLVPQSIHGNMPRLDPRFLVVAQGPERLIPTDKVVYKDSMGRPLPRPIPPDDPPGWCGLFEDSSPLWDWRPDLRWFHYLAALWVGVDAALAVIMIWGVLL